MKDHQIRELVSELVVIAKDFGNTQQLREHIREAVFKVLTPSFLATPAPLSDEPVAISDDHAHALYKLAHQTGFVGWLNEFRKSIAAGASNEHADAAPTPSDKQEAVAYVNGDELDNMLDDRVATIQGKPDGWRKTPLYAAPPVTPSDKQDELGPFRHKCRSCGGIFGARHWKPICSTCRANATSIDKQEASMTRAGIACLQRYAFRPNTRMNSLEKDSEGSWLRYSDVVRVVEGAIKKDPK
jgi:hypothetical protein